MTDKNCIKIIDPIAADIYNDMYAHHNHSN